MVEKGFKPEPVDVVWVRDRLNEAVLHITETSDGLKNFQGKCLVHINVIDRTLALIESRLSALESENSDVKSQMAQTGRCQYWDCGWCHHPDVGRPYKCMGLLNVGCPLPSTFRKAESFPGGENTDPARCTTSSGSETGKPNESEPVTWRPLLEGEVVEEGDEVDASTGWNDEPRWEPATNIGEKAPSPYYVAHRQYRRKPNRAEPVDVVERLIKRVTWDTDEGTRDLCRDAITLIESQREKIEEWKEAKKAWEALVEHWRDWMERADRAEAQLAVAREALEASKKKIKDDAHERAARYTVNDVEGLISAALTKLQQRGEG